MRHAGVIAHLEVETCAYHATSDHLWLALVTSQDVIAEADYLHRLVRTYGFEAPVEAALAYTPHLHELVDVFPRFRSGLIAQDLLRLGLTAKQVAAIPQDMIAPFATVPEALGWLYVHERATLIHDRVRRELVRRAPHLERATSYLGAHAATAVTSWNELGDTLDRIARHPEIEDRIVRGALDGYHASLRWQQSVHAPAQARRA